MHGVTAIPNDLLENEGGEQAVFALTLGRGDGLKAFHMPEKCRRLG